MNERSYKLIFFLLTACVICILGVQAFWLKNFYAQKKEEFNRTVYDALEEAGTRLRDRKNLESLKMTYFVEDGDTLFKTPSRNQIIIETEDNLTILKHDTVDVRPKLKALKKLRRSKDTMMSLQSDLNSASMSVSTSKSSVMLSSGSHNSAHIVMEGTKKLEEKMKGVVDKMINEIIILDTETRNPDTVQALIRHSLENRGLLLPFEFSYQRNLKDKNPEILSQSKNYSPKPGDFKSDLTGDNIIPTRQMLYLQFSGQNDYVMAGMKSSIFLSLLLSLVILSVFYYVLRLIRRQKKLSDMKNDFVNNMTHELKTPIATISLAVDAMNNQQIRHNEERFKEYSRILKEENQKLNKHVEDVLQMSLLDKGELRFENEPVDLGTLIQKVIATYKLRILEQQADVSFQEPAQAILVRGDHKHLSNVMSNLLDNALKYSGEKAFVEIFLIEKGAEVELHVKDKGIGIAEEHQAKIFGKFYRVQGGNLHDVKGFGLGLSYVKSVVEGLGGSIALSSSPGKGSDFILRFSTT